MNITALGEPALSRTDPATRSLRSGSTPTSAASNANGTAATDQPTPAPGLTPEAKTSVDDGADAQKKLREAIDATNQFLSPVAQSLRFEVDDQSGRTLVQVVDKETNKVLRQIPSQEMLSISKALDRFQGLMVQQKA